MLNFDPHRWLAEREGAENVATVATVARVCAELEKSASQVSPATLATTATKSGCDPSINPTHIDLSGFDVRDVDEGWIGESPRQTRLRLIHGGRVGGGDG